MKHCTHCGAPIKESAAAFCPKCKKPLKTRRLVPTKPKQTPQSTSNSTDRRPSTKKIIPHEKKAVPPLASRIQKKKPHKKKKPWFSAILKPKKEKMPDVECLPVINPMDENYDGYYDDKPTEDNGQDKEILDPELIKRIAFISCGAIIFIIFAIILMNLL